jgi:hypothetical protein
MLIYRDVDLFLRAFYLESSAFSKTDFYPRVFVQPLYEPHDYLFFTYGNRLIPPDNFLWDTSKDSPEALTQELLRLINTMAIPFLDRFSEPIDLAMACESPPPAPFNWPKDDVNVLEAAAHSWILADNPRKAIEKLHRLLQTIKPDWLKTDWIRDLQGRASTFLDWLESGNEARAREQLLAWREYTIGALKLTEYQTKVGRTL